MKRFAPQILGLILSSAVMVPVAFAAAGFLDMANADPAYVINYDSDNVISPYSDETSDAINSSAGDVKFYPAVGDHVYIGYKYPFDGVTINFDTEATGGDFVMEYWNDSSEAWEEISFINNTFIDPLDMAIGNDVRQELSNDNHPSFADSDMFTRTWDSAELEGWSDREVDGSSERYFVRIYNTARYDNPAYASQVHIIHNSLLLTAENELGEVVPLQAGNVLFASDAGHDTTVYHEYNMALIGDGRRAFGFDAPEATGDDYRVAVTASGYVVEFDALTDLDFGRTRVEETVTLESTHKYTVQDDWENDVTLSSAEATGNGDPVTCGVSGNRAYCAIPWADDNDDSTSLYADGYVAKRVENVDRNGFSPAEEYTVSMEHGYFLRTEDPAGALVSGARVEMSDGSLCVELDEGEFGCALALGVTPDYTVTLDGYAPVTGGFNSTRTDAFDAQVSKVVLMTYEEEETTTETSTTEPETTATTTEAPATSDEADEDVECEHDFDDVVGHWAEKAICLVTDAGYVDALDVGEYGPNVATTRVDFLKLVLLNAGYDVEAVDGIEYSDVDEDDEAYRWVSFATDMEFVMGYEDGTFRPNDEINRVEALIMILKVAGVDSFEVPDEDLPFSDVESDDWFAWVVYAAVENGLVQGYSDGSFRPGRDISRAEMALIARRVTYSFYPEFL